MKTIVKYILLTLLCLSFLALLSSCGKKDVPSAVPAAGAFDMEVTTVDAVWDFDKGSIVQEASVSVTVTSGDDVDYAMEYAVDGGDKVTMKKLWKSVSRKIVDLPLDMGRRSCRVKGSVFREDGFGERRTFDVTVYFRSPDIYEFGYVFVRRVAGGRTEEVVFDGSPVHLSLWDSPELMVSSQPAGTVFSLEVNTSDLSVVRVESVSGTSARLLVLREADAVLTVKTSNGPQVTTCEIPVRVSEDPEVIDHRLTIENAVWVSGEEEGVWNAGFDATLSVSFGNCDSTAGHDILLLIDGEKVEDRKGVTIEHKGCEFRLHYGLVSTLVDLSVGTHSFEVQAGRTDGHAFDSFKGTFEVTHTMAPVKVDALSVSSEHWKGESLEVTSEVSYWPDAEGDMVFEYIIDGDASSAWSVEVPYRDRPVAGTCRFTHTIPASKVPLSAGGHTVALYVSLVGTDGSSFASAEYQTRAQALTLTVSPDSVNGLSPDISSSVSLSFKVTCEGRTGTKYVIRIAGVTDDRQPTYVRTGTTAVFAKTVSVTVPAGTHSLPYTAILYTPDGAVQVATARTRVSYTAKEKPSHEYYQSLTGNDRY